MKKILLSFAIIINLFIIGCTDIALFMAGMFEDDRDGRIYKIGDIGNGDVWLMENLAYNGKTEYTCEETADACPKGWHLPSYSEWSALDKLWKENSGEFNSVGNSWWGVGTIPSTCHTWTVLFNRLNNIMTDKGSNYIRCVKD